MDCIFCDILAGRAPVSWVYHDEVVAAFMDIQPVNTGHVLVIPRRHATSLAELDVEAGAQLFRVSQRIAQALRKSGLPCEGVNFFLADGEAAGQEVFHVHLHIFPRYTGDGFGFEFGPHYRTLPARADLDQAAEQLRNTLAISDL
jgi:histidine triad (HIT) family protein